MSTIILKQSRDSYDLLERMLNNTTLTAQRATHRHILKAGECVRTGSYVDIEGDRAKAVKEALAKSDKRHGREIKAALHRLEQELDADKATTLHRQQQYYEELAGRVAEQRDKAEEQRRHELKRHFDKVREEVLASQREESEREKLLAIQEACDAIQRRLRNDFVLEKEKAIADALARAREKFRVRESQSIARTREQCATEAAEEAARAARQHAQQLKLREQRYEALTRKYEQEVVHKRRVEQDFSDLQTDYKRFIDYTDGQYHSDFMMRLRRHGLGLSNRRISVVTYEDVDKLDT